MPSSSTRLFAIRCIFFSAIGTIVLVWLIGTLRDACSGETVIEAMRKDGAINCIDYWASRYQSLISGGAALIGAGFVLWQVRLMERQLAHAIGDMPPTFTLHESYPNGHVGQLRPAYLDMENSGRRKVQVRKIQLNSPLHLKFTIGPEPATLEARKKSAANVDGIHCVSADWKIDSGESRRFWVSFTEGSVNTDRAGLEERVSITITYRLIGSDHEERSATIVGYIGRVPAQENYDLII